MEKPPLPVPRLGNIAVALREWEPADLPVLLAAGRDPVVSRFRYSLPRSEQEAADWLRAARRERLAGERLELAVTAVASPTAVGSIALTDLEHRGGMLRYWLLPEARGRGLATQAVRLLARWAFGELGLGRLALFIEPENVASQALAARCGFVLERVLPKHTPGRDGQPVDLMLYGRLPGELPVRPAPRAPI